MRLSELLALRWKMVDLDASGLHIVENLQYDAGQPLFDEPGIEGKPSWRCCTKIRQNVTPEIMKTVTGGNVLMNIDASVFNELNKPPIKDTPVDSS